MTELVGDDGARARGEHVRQRRAGDPHRRDEVEVTVLPVLVGDSQEAVEPRRDRADVVDEDVERARTRERAATSTAGPSGVPRSTWTGCDARPARRQRPAGRWLAGAGGDDALGDQGPGDGEADALARAGDDGDLACQADVHHRPCLCSHRPWMKTTGGASVGFGHVDPPCWRRGGDRGPGRTVSRRSQVDGTFRYGYATALLVRSAKEQAP